MFFPHVFCLCGSSYIYQKTKQTKTHINLIFFSLNEEKKKVVQRIKAKPTKELFYD